MNKKKMSIVILITIVVIFSTVLVIQKKEYKVIYDEIIDQYEFSWVEGGLGICIK